MQNVSTAQKSVQNIDNINKNVDKDFVGTQVSAQSKPKTIEEQMKSDQEQIQNIQKEIKNIQSRMQINQSKVQSIQNQMQNEQNKMLIIQNQMQNGHNQMQTIQNQIQSDKSQMQNIQNQMQNGHNQMQTIQNQIQSDKNQMENIQNQMLSIQSRIQANKIIMQDRQKQHAAEAIQNKQNQMQNVSFPKQSKQNQMQSESNLTKTAQNQVQNDKIQTPKIQNQQQIDERTSQDKQMQVQIQNSNLLQDKATNIFNDEININQNSDFTRIPIVDICNSIIIAAVKARASDIHFDPTDDGISVRIRIDGLLRDYLKLPREIKQNVTTRIKIMAGMNITETRLPQDGAIKNSLNGLDLDLRVSSLPTKRGEKIVIRILDYSMSLKGIEYLYFSETNYNKVLKMLSTPNGIILVTGATGTGKSTTLYSFLQKLNVEGSNLITVEDPVEMDIDGVNQVQVNSEIGLDFATVLRSILRQDPNVIMIGEIRDSETAQIAVRASITGHLVLSTIHTNNSLNTIERLLDMDVERYLLASALEGIVSQKLARKLCNKCKIKRPVTETERNLFKSVLGQDINEIYAPNPSGCPNCNHGYKGRIAVQEVLLINQDIRDAISAGMRKDDLRNLVYSKDVITMLQDGLFKVVAGFTTTDEILKLIEVDDSDFGVK